MHINTRPLAERSTLVPRRLGGWRGLLAALPLSHDGLVVVEHRAGTLGAFCPPSHAFIELRKWGTTGMAFFGPSPAADGPDSA